MKRKLIFFVLIIANFLYADFKLNPDEDFQFYDYYKFENRVSAIQDSLSDFDFEISSYKFFGRNGLILNAFASKSDYYSLSIGAQKYLSSQFKISTLIGSTYLEKDLFPTFEISLYKNFQNKFKFSTNLYSDYHDEISFENKTSIKFLITKFLEWENTFNSNKYLATELEFFSKKFSLYLTATYNNIKTNSNYLGIGFRIYNFRNKFNYNNDEIQNYLRVDINKEIKLPITVQEDQIYIKKLHNLEYGTSAIILMPLYQPKFYTYKVKKGDNLNKISKNLPNNVLPNFKGKAQEIAKYNSIKNVSKIKVGQRIKVPTIAKYDSLTIDPKIREKVESLIDLNLKKNYRESAVLAANWLFLLGNTYEAEKALPMFGDMKALDYLNIKAIIYMEKQKFEKAKEFWSYALEQDPDNPILLLNASQADYWTKDYKSAKEKVEKFLQSDVYIKWIDDYEELLNKKL